MAEPPSLWKQKFYHLWASRSKTGRWYPPRGQARTGLKRDVRSAVTEDSKGSQSDSPESQHRQVACTWVWSGPHSVLKKLKIAAKIEN